MSILNNAVLSIQMGLEDLAAGTEGRVLSGVRNFHAGVLLLLKHKLHEMSPPGTDGVLIRRKILPRIGSTGRVDFIGKGDRTVDAYEIEERLKALGIAADWKRIENLTKVRNNIEHFYAKLPAHSLREVAAEVYVVVYEFTTNVLDKDSRELFGNDAWEHLIENEKVVKAERDACLKALRMVAWPSDILKNASLECFCPDCGAHLLKPVDPTVDFDEMWFACRSCDHEMGAGDFAEIALRETCPFDHQRAAHDGDVDPLATCPFCDRHTFVRGEDTCAFCSYELEDKVCRRCGNPLDVDEQEFNGLCAYCDHVLSKDD